MVDVTLTANGLPLRDKLSTYGVTKTVSYQNVITTLDGVEHPYPGVIKTIITFSLLPMTDEESKAVYDAIKGLVFSTTYTDPYTNTTETMRVRLTTDLSSAFALVSIDGKRRYKGDIIQLKEL